MYPMPKTNVPIRILTCLIVKCRQSQILLSLNTYIAVRHAHFFLQGKMVLEHGEAVQATVHQWFGLMLTCFQALDLGRQRFGLML